MFYSAFAFLYNQILQPYFIHASSSFSSTRTQHALHAFTNTHWPDLTSSQQFWFVCIIYEYTNIAHNVCVLLKVDIFALYARCLACCFSLSGIHIAFHGVPFVNVYLSLFSQILMHKRRNPASIISLSCGGHLVILGPVSIFYPF